MNTSKGLLLGLLLVFFTKLLYSQTNEWTWVRGATTINNTGFYGTQGTPSSVNNPRARYLGTSWTDAAGNLWMFGGSGYNTAASLEESLNDLWKYNTGTNTWVWMKGSNTPNMNGVYGAKGIAAPTNSPGARRLGMGWKDKAGNLWLYGGHGYAAPAAWGYLSDLWKYDPVSNEWTWMKGDTTSNAPPIYGAKSIPSPANSPGGRYGCVSWTDTSGNFWLFGGYTTKAGNTVFFNDLWKYNVSSGAWAWIKGDSTLNADNVYGTQGIASPGNKPGGRVFSVSYTDVSDNLWLFAGFENHTGSFGLANDIWKYNPAINQWTWVKGDSTINSYCVYGTQGNSSPSGKTGGRETAYKWIDSSGKMWVFGGYGYTDNGSQGYLNDLWNYNPASNEWAWEKGDKITNSTGVYGIQSIPAPANNPGARHAGISWTDTAGNLWLFGGWGYGTSNAAAGDLNDIWKYTPGHILPVHLLTFAAELEHSSSLSLEEGQDEVKLNWTAENEQSFDRYEVERSSNGRMFEKIGSVKAVSSQLSVVSKQYSYDDFFHSQLTAYNSLYYRLKMIDKDGSFTYSKTEKVSLNIQHTTFNIFPNPATTSVQLQFSKPITDKVEVYVSDASGKVVLRKSIAASDVVTLSTSRLPTGNYVVKVVNEGEEYVQKMIVK